MRRDYRTDIKEMTTEQLYRFIAKKSDLVSSGYSDDSVLRKVVYAKNILSDRTKEGWTTPTLAYIDGQWRIYSDSAVAFVPL